jgi:hypothetical protein
VHPAHPRDLGRIAEDGNCSPSLPPSNILPNLAKNLGFRRTPFLILLEPRSIESQRPAILCSVNHGFQRTIGKLGFDLTVAVTLASALETNWRLVFRPSDEMPTGVGCQYPHQKITASRCYDIKAR